jgi:hypothetical protein
MSLRENFQSPALYSTELRSTDVVKDGIVFFCGRPASWIAYKLYSKPKSHIPSIENARKTTNKVCRSPDSFRPDPFKKLKKTIVYRAKFVFTIKEKLRYICVFDEEGNLIETFFYAPLV